MTVGAATSHAGAVAVAQQVQSAAYIYDAKTGAPTDLMLLLRRLPRVKRRRFNEIAGVAGNDCQVPMQSRRLNHAVKRR